MLGQLGATLRAALLLALLPATRTACRHADVDALYWLYEHTDGANWKLNTNWAPHLDPCYLVSRWVGVGAIDPCDRWRDGPDCAFGRITAVYLGNNGLSGNITGWSGLGELHNLTMLDLSWNNLTGALPTEIGKINTLTTIDLSNNRLDGTLPTEIGAINWATRHARPGDEYMGDYGRIETHLKLIDLMLVNNRISGQIPSELARHDFLGSADLRRNAFGGHLPRELGNLSRISSLQLDDNSISGTLPDDWGEGLDTVKYVMLARNAISGTLPDALGEMLEVNKLHLQENRLSGTIPEDLCDAVNLRSLMLHDNALTGNLPGDIGQLTKLQWLDVYNNSMTGDVPPGIAKLRDLKHLYLANEHLRPIRQYFCRQRQNPRLGKYSWVMVAWEYHRLMAAPCEGMYDTAFTFNSLTESGWEDPDDEEDDDDE